MLLLLFLLKVSKNCGLLTMTEKGNILANMHFYTNDYFVAKNKGFKCHKGHIIGLCFHHNDSNFNYELVNDISLLYIMRVGAFRNLQISNLRKTILNVC